MKQSYLFLALFAGIGLLALYEAGAGGQGFAPFASFLGLAGFFLLSATLMIGPAAVLNAKEFASLIDARKAVGLAAFIFVCAHIFLVLSKFFGWNLGIALSPLDNLLAMVAFIIIFILAITSPDPIMKAIGMGNWKTIHRFVYLAFILSAFHFIAAATRTSRGNFNIAEIAVLAIGALAVILQILGAWTRIKRAKEAQAKPA